MVADANLVVGKALNGEVLAELAADEVIAAEFLLPVPIRREVVDVDRPVLTAVRGEVGVGVAPSRSAG